MKRISLTVLALVTVLSLFACSANSAELYQKYSDGLAKNSKLSIVNRSLELSVTATVNSQKTSYMRNVFIKSDKGKDQTARIQSETKAFGQEESTDVYYAHSKAYISDTEGKYITDDKYDDILPDYLLLSGVNFPEKMFENCESDSDKKGIETVKFSSSASPVAKEIFAGIADIAGEIGGPTEKDIEKAVLSAELTFDNNGYMTDCNFELTFNTGNNSSVTLKSKSKLIYPGEFVLIKEPDELDSYVSRINEEPDDPESDNEDEDTTTTATGSDDNNTTTLTYDQKEADEIISSIDSMQLDGIDKEALKKQIDHDLKYGTTTTVTVSTSAVSAPSAPSSTTSASAAITTTTTKK